MKAFALALILSCGVGGCVTPPEPAVSYSEQEARLIACWQGAASTGDHFTIQEKGQIVKWCMEGL